MGLTENIKTVVATIEELATAIEEKGVDVPECASFTEYPDLIRKIEGEEVPLKSHSTVFAFTESEDTPDISVLSNVTYSPDTGADFSNAKEWSSGQFMAPRSITEPIVWESHAIFNSDGENTTGWSAPIRKTGKDGINGESIKGDKGDQGEPGKDGIDGKDGISTELIYKRVSDSSVQVETPSSYDLDKYQPEGWTLFPQGVDVNYQIEYVCQREKIDGEWGNYSNPAIWAMYGAIGKDGNGIEYIYKLSEDRPDTPIAPDTTGLLDESFPSDWSDNPLSVDEINTICWVSTRKQSYINDVQKWGEYSVPTIWSKFGKDGTDGTDGKDGVDGIDGAPGVDGVGISEIIKRYELGNDPQNHPEFSESSTTDPSTLVTNYNTARYIWCQETTIYTNGNSTSIYYIVTVHGEPGANGTGNDAPIIYPAGVWSADKEYIAESNKVPYVFYAVDGKYYMLNSKELIIGEGEGSVWKGSKNAPGTIYEEEPIWTEMESFEAIYSDIGLFNQALVGKWVFHGDYMFSQEGVGYKADSTTKYTTYDAFNDPSTAISNWISGQYISPSSKDWFKPNFLVNSKTGDFYASKGVLDNSLLFKSGESESYSIIGWNDIAQGVVDFSQKQQWVLTSKNNYGTTYPTNKIGSLPIAQVSVLNLEGLAKLDGDVKFVSGTKSGTLVIPSNTLFQGMTYNGKCYCPSDYTATNCSGGVDGTVTYITPWENPGYDLEVFDTYDMNQNRTASLLDSNTRICNIAYNCPNAVISYSSDSLIMQKVIEGENGQILFTWSVPKAGQYQYYIDVYFYFEELCVGRYCIGGNLEVYED